MPGAVIVALQADAGGVPSAFLIDSQVASVRTPMPASIAPPAASATTAGAAPARRNAIRPSETLNRPGSAGRSEPSAASAARSAENASADAWYAPSGRSPTEQLVAVPTVLRTTTVPFAIRQPAPAAPAAVLHESVAPSGESVGKGISMAPPAATGNVALALSSADASASVYVPVAKARSGHHSAAYEPGEASAYATCARGPLASASVPAHAAAGPAPAASRSVANTAMPGRPDPSSYVPPTASSA